ncbi:MAG TPA: serine/threonine-protein kinase [Urbifossiella sp.]|jgi:tRNA A-37 threonylcarbamoyl transferase component Bud32|nr:serine/threonine-protein kinase [Urbifossiella sp.]
MNTPDPDPCPGPDVLADFHRGDLDPAASESVGEHLAACPRCDVLYADLDGGSEIVSNLRRFLGWETSAGGADEYRELERKARAIRIGDAADAPPALLLPAHLGKYLLTEELGRGGMGVVYAAVHTVLNKRVAVKVVLPEYADHPRSVARFRQETRAVGELTHPNVVAATDADEADGRPFLVMELVDGLDLASLLRRVGPLPVAAACEMARQAAVGLQYVHERGRVHRDLKPSNLMVAADGVVKILDLGLAAFRAGTAPAGDLTASRQVMGTADYTAPEQWADSRRADIRADVYSLGCTLYHLLAGRPPFSGPEHNTLVRKQFAHAEAPPPSVRAARPDVPPELDAVIRRMLAKDPADRFPTPQAVADALLPFAAGDDCRAVAAGAMGPDRRAAAGVPDETVADRCLTPVFPPGTTTTRPVPRRWRLALAALVLLAGGGVGWVTLAPGLKPGGNPQPPPGEPVPPDPGPGGGDPGPQPNEWYELLRRPPKQLAWGKSKNDNLLDYQAGSRSVYAFSPHVGVLGLGATDQADYEIQMGIKQIPWTGGVGVFIGYHDVVFGGQGCKRVQVLRLHSDPPRSQFYLQRAWVVLTDRNEIRAFQSLAAERVETPVGHRQYLLTVKVVRGRLIEARWGNTACTTLVTPENARQLTPDDFRGDFGVYVQEAGATFSHTQLMLY